MSQVKVVRRRVEDRPAPPERSVARRLAGYRALGIVSSTGGPSALIQLLGGLGAGFPLPILLVQHIAGSFLEGFAAWLENACPFSVEIVRGRSLAAPGRVCLAAQDHHLRTEKGFVRLDCDPPVCAQRPSGTVLFDSMAAAFRGNALGVLLTGMGEDGAAGL